MPLYCKLSYGLPAQQLYQHQIIDSICGWCLRKNFQSKLSSVITNTFRNSPHRPERTLLNSVHRFSSSQFVIKPLQTGLYFCRKMSSSSSSSSNYMANVNNNMVNNSNHIHKNGHHNNKSSQLHDDSSTLDNVHIPDDVLTRLPDLSIEHIREQLRQCDPNCNGRLELNMDDSTGIATLCINSPQRKNAFSGFMMAQFSDLLDQLERWKKVRLITKFTIY